MGARGNPQFRIRETKQRNVRMMARQVAFAVSVAGMFCAVRVFGMPLPGQGPHAENGWDQVVRLRHLYAARHGLHLLISGDGDVHGSTDQTLYSLLEIRPVDTGCVVIKGVAASHFLCMEENGRLYSSLIYTKDDCTFREHILPDGYNVYASDKHGTLVSLGSHRQRVQGRDRGLPALSQFLPRVSTLDPQVSGSLTQPDHGTAHTQRDGTADTMDSFGKVSQIIHSPSFNER